MSLTRAEIESVLDELEKLVDRARLQKIREVNPQTRIFRLRIPGETHNLLISLERELTRIHFTQRVPEQPPKPTPFTMQLRKWLEGALLTGVKLLNRDRVVELEYNTSRRPDAEDVTPKCSIICELTGIRPNLFLLDESREIRGQLNEKTIGERKLSRGKDYRTPPPPPEAEAAEQNRWSGESSQSDPFCVSRAIDRFYRRKTREKQLDALYSELESRLETQLERLENRIPKLESDLRSAGQADRYQKWGELLQSAWGRVKKGNEEVTVTDYYDDEMPEITIPLDPDKSLQENIDYYFHQYNRYSKASTRIQKRLDKTKTKIKNIRDAIAELADEAFTDIEQLKAFKASLLEKNLLEKASSQSGRPKPDDQGEPYRKFQSNSGRDILVGRSAKDNDKLTTSVARGRDFWFHARDWPGSHVILRMEKYEDSPASDDFIDAATLAAYFSKGGSDTKLEVAYTRAKHVDKPKGYPPGLVTMSGDSTILVEIEDKRLERLLESRDVN